MYKESGKRRIGGGRESMANLQWSGERRYKTEHRGKIMTEWQQKNIVGP